MARAWYLEQVARAEDLASAGQADDAADTYLRASEMVGIPELARQAEERREELLND